MALPPERAPVGYTTVPVPETDAELLVVPWFEGECPDDVGVAAIVPGMDAAMAGELGRALASREFTGKLYELFLATVHQSLWKARRIMVVGAGARATFGPSIARRLATASGLAARDRKVARMAFACPQERAALDDARVIQAVVEGLTLAEFQPGRYKTDRSGLVAIPDWVVVGGAAGPAVEQAITRGRILGECSNRVRELANEPANVLTSREFATRAVALAAEGGIAGRILDESEIEALGMGLLLAVSRGSAEPPRVVVLRYDPPGVADGPVLGLVGKGITFDTGGISIKPADNMDRMKDDMSGGAAVAAAMRAIGLLGAPVRVIGVIPIAENMPGSRAYRPGDVIKSAEGKSVEVLNTDAEGRLLLGDALWYARRLGATHLIDVATLTGAVVVALGKAISGLFGTPEPWVEHVRRVGDAAGDAMWPMPLLEDYREQLKSDIADFSNTGGRPAGSITAALFLKEFVGGVPWAHLDIAGTAWTEEARPYLPKGPSGVAVRTLAELAIGADAWAGRIK
jgi:leucyl aminopeptidase